MALAVSLKLLFSIPTWSGRSRHAFSLPSTDSIVPPSKPMSQATKPRPCAWPSTNPGISIWPWRLMTSVSGPISLRAPRFLPT